MASSVSKSNKKLTSTQVINSTNEQRNVKINGWMNEQTIWRPFNLNGRNNRPTNGWKNGLYNRLPNRWKW